MLYNTSDVFYYPFKFGDPRGVIMPLFKLLLERKATFCHACHACHAQQ